MRYSIFYILILLLVVPMPRGLAQTASNADFNPFPQMEQDQQNADDQTVPAPQQQNDDWPPANDGAQANGDGAHD
jgi:hypothetical protein